MERSKEGRKEGIRTKIRLRRAMGSLEDGFNYRAISNFRVAARSSFVPRRRRDEEEPGEKFRSRRCVKELLVTRSTRFSLRKSSCPASREFRANSTRRFTKLGTRDVVARDDFAGALLLIEK